MANVGVTALIGQKQVPLLGYDISGGAYGSVGHASMITSLTALEVSGIDLVELTAAAPAQTTVGITVNIEGTNTLIFGGEYLNARWTFDQNEVIIHARDWSGVLVDQKRILTPVAGAVAGVLKPGQTGNVAGIATQNQKIGDIVTSIATEFGLTPVLNLTADNNPTAGSIYGSDDSVFLTIPQSLWAVLNQFARDTGYEVYTTPDKKLVFGIPGAGLTPQTFSYNMNLPPVGALPCKGLDIEHNPRRNMTFRVVVTSYDPAKAQITQGQTNVVGTDFSNSDINPGLWNGPDAKSIDQAFVKSQAKIPLYSFHVDGLTAAQAQLKASAIALDIAKRELVVTLQCDCLPSVRPTQQVNLTGTTNKTFDGHDYFINSFGHRFRMPRESGKGGGSFVTTVRALDIQVQGAGKPVKK